MIHVKVELFMRIELHVYNKLEGIDVSGPFVVVNVTVSQFTTLNIRYDVSCILCPTSHPCLF